MRAGLRFLAAGVLALALGGAAAHAPAADFAAAPENIRAHMAYLASDELEGRDAGSPGYDLAAAYVAKQFRDMGLKPLGADGTFLQPVTLIRHRALDEASVTLTPASGAPIALVKGEDFRAPTQAHGRDVSVTAPAVFAGFGVVAPGRNDFEGLDVRGRIVVALDGAPSTLSAAERQFAASPRGKAQMAERYGAVGLILISQTPIPAVRPAQQVQGPWAWTWARADGDAAYPGVPILATLAPQGAEKLFAGAPSSWESINAAARAGGADLPRFALPGRIEASAKGELGEVRQSSNVVALIEGSDPALKNQYVVMSGHLDHVGRQGRPIGDDDIHNGALDNAGGIATLIEAARAFSEGPKPRRSIIFLAVTAEEKGLIGADYFVRNPPIPRAGMVANVNLDMPVMTYDFIDVAAIGAEHSTIIEAVERAAGAMGVKVSPDPVPQLGIFTRSDHYRFVEQGVPAVFLIGGFENGGEKAFNDFYNNRYHRPTDDLKQAIDYQAAAKWARLNYEIARELADQTERPVFHRDNLFGGRFAAPEAIAR